MDKTASELFVLTRVVDATDPHWDERMTIVGTRAQISKTVDLSRGVPFGWRLLRGKKARRFLKWSLAQESAWWREQQLKSKGGGLN
jgi:hypothetical protein